MNKSNEFQKLKKVTKLSLGPCENCSYYMEVGGREDTQKTSSVEGTVIYAHDVWL